MVSPKCPHQYVAALRHCTLVRRGRGPVRDAVTATVRSSERGIDDSEGGGSESGEKLGRRYRRGHCG